MPSAALRRLAVTLEQCWHEVPGGTATSALQSIRALLSTSQLEMIGVAAMHRRPPGRDFVAPIPVAHLPLPRPALYESWHRFRWPAVERATGPVDAIHVTGMAMPPKSAPMIVTVHDLAFVHDPSQFTAHGVRFFERAIELARRDADIVVVPSQATLDDCAAHGFDPARLRLVPWGIDAAAAGDDEVTRVRRLYGLPRPYVFWNGTIEPRKNLTTVLDAFALVVQQRARARASAVDLVVAGPRGWNDELEVLEARASERVRRVGFVSDADLRALHAGAELFCFPSLREGFGLPVLEAMAQGTPVITSATTSTAEVVGPSGGAGILVEPRDVEAVAAAIASLLDDDGRRASMGAAARARAGTYSWSSCASALLQAYDDAVVGGR